MSKSGPTSSALTYCLALSNFGSALTAGGLLNLPDGRAATGMTRHYFTGTFVWPLIELITKDHPDGL